jgi:hypothetical protein
MISADVMRGGTEHYTGSFCTAAKCDAVGISRTFSVAFKATKLKTVIPAKAGMTVLRSRAENSPRQY